MYRRTDPRFRRTLNDISHTLESANESAQSNLYIFGQHYVSPCFHSIGDCFASCFEAGCPTLNVSARDRLRRRGRARSRGRAPELSFDFYDDWEDLDEQDGLLGWGGGEEGLAGLTSARGYGTLGSAGEVRQPGREAGMSYSKGRRKSVEEAVGVGAGVGFWGRLFGGKALRYAPSAADLQEHPGSRRLGRERTEGEALLEGDEGRGGRRPHRRVRSDTVGSGQTTDSYSSRGDLFPSDEEADAIPLDDEFAMVLERRTTNSGQASAPESEASSGKRGKKGKRPSAGSRTSTRRTYSSRSVRSRRESRRGSTPAAETPTSELAESPMRELSEHDAAPVSMEDLRRQEKRVEAEEEEAVRMKREAAERVAARQGLTKEGPSSHVEEVEDDALEDTAGVTTPHAPAQMREEEPSQLPTPLATDDEEEQQQHQQRRESASSDEATTTEAKHKSSSGS